jgi:GTP pyrophosphokinase
MGNMYAADMGPVISLDELLVHESLLKHRSSLRRAFALMLHAPAEADGQDYANMVIETSMTVAADMGLGADAVKCVILKNVYESGKLKAADFDQDFGQPARLLIEGILKLEQLDTTKYYTNKENFIGLILTLSDDIRVPLIRLAMRLYDMRHLEHYAYEKQCRIVGETQALYIPISHRLGLYRIKNEMEDLVMKFTDAKTYDLIARKLTETSADREEYTQDFIDPIRQSLEQHGFDCEIKSRVKSIPSIRRKMKVQKVDFEKVYDLFAIRIILNEVVENEAADCWRIYSLVTNIYTPNPRRLRDWISFPKPTGYESLHTTVVGPGGRWVEVQIRTRRMDEIAEKGFAAHWKYKSGEKQEVRPDFFASLRTLLESPATLSQDQGISADKKALYSTDIFIFTPKGDLKKLHSGYTVLDFAFDIHTEIGFSCSGAMVNGKMVPLKYVLQNGDTVKIVTSKTQRPNQGWLDIAKSPRVIARIKHALKMDSYKDADWGKEILKNKVVQLGYDFTDVIIKKLADFFGCGENILELYQLFGEGKGDLLKVKKALAPQSEISPETASHKEDVFADNISGIHAGHDDFVIIDPAIKSLHYQFARCCNPKPGEPIYAFVSVNQGIKIHATSCSNAREMITRYPYRVLEARWKETTAQEPLKKSVQK